MGGLIQELHGDNSLEPDMVRTTGEENFKRYKIYRAYSTNSGTSPLTYTYIGTYDDFTPNDTANFTDDDIHNGVRILCGDDEEGYDDVYYRYKISAVDVTNWESVLSDFVSIKGHPNEPDSPGNLTGTESPFRYSLRQNYPNPFNPVTDIKFELPQNTYVTIKIYNALGEEVAVLVNNEWKSTGRYSVKFDGSNLASGIYFYHIEAGTFKDTKKMVLIK